MKRRRVRNILLMVAIIYGFLLPANAQHDSLSMIQRTNRAIVYRSDTLPVMMIPQVNIYNVNKYNYLKSWRYRREIRNVKKAYPYAIIANRKLNNLDDELVKIHSKKEQKEYLDIAEKELMNEFEDQIKKMTISQGIILVKLIDRETGRTSYEVLREIKGGFTAFFWQGIARIFGNDLKLQYDPDGEDKLIEDIVMAIDQGFI